MSDFAKLFALPEFGQVLCVARGDENNEPKLTFSFLPAGLGVCDIAIGFSGEDRWEKMDKAFASADEDVARGLGASLYKELGIAI